ncbi:MAG: hypothetical protein IKF19_01735 [Bacilli bacterium]|nr:hypothetical protein [Bacilli bacterium]
MDNNENKEIENVNEIEKKEIESVEKSDNTDNTIKQGEQPKYDSMTGEPLTRDRNGIINNAGHEQQSKKNNSDTKKVLIILGVVVLIGGLLGSLLFFKLFGSTKKYVCKSSMGNITIIYNKKTILGYATTGGISYDLDGQKKIAEQIGVDYYLDEFNDWFVLTTSGTCK